MDLLPDSAPNSRVEKAPLEEIPVGMLTEELVEALVGAPAVGGVNTAPCVTPRFKIEDGEIAPHLLEGQDGADWIAGMRRAFGTQDASVIISLILDAGYVFSNAWQVDRFVAGVQNIGPKDHVELYLAVHMELVNLKALELMRRSKHAVCYEIRESLDKRAASWFRLYLQQMDALKKYRRQDLPSLSVGQVVADKALFAGHIGQQSEPPACRQGK